jgi:hypothetical protein
MKCVAEAIVTYAHGSDQIVFVHSTNIGHLWVVTILSALVYVSFEKIKLEEKGNFLSYQMKCCCLKTIWLQDKQLNPEQ